MADQKTHRKLEISVVGLSYRATPATLEKIAMATPLKAKLQREPTNAHDENAIMVVLTEKPWPNFHIGYVPREVAKELAPKMDSGEVEISKVTLLKVDLIDNSGELAVKAWK